MESAAFVRVEGVLTGRPTLATAAWLAANAQWARQRVSRLGAAALAVPFALTGARTTASRVAWSSLRGLSEDRIVVLGEEYYELHLEPGLLERGLELVRNARKTHPRVVLISDNIERVIAPLAASLDAELICNRLEIR